MTDATAAPELTDDEVFEQKAVRLAKRERLIAAGAARRLSGHACRSPTPSPRCASAFGELGPEPTPASTVGVAGRVVFSAQHRQAVLRDAAGRRRQPHPGDGVARRRRRGVAARAGRSSSTSATTSSWRGEVISSRRGELSIMVAEWQIAAKAILPLPNMYTELSEETPRPQPLPRPHRPRAGARDRASPAPKADACAARHLRRRTASSRSRRRCCRCMHGGASARPFVTHCERVRHRAVPAHRARAVPQARRGRRHRPGLRDQPQLPQRGRRLHHSPRVRHARGLPGVRRLQPDRRPHPGADPERRARRRPARTSVTWADGTEYDLGGELGPASRCTSR